jgi:hypothetical protein
MAATLRADGARCYHADAPADGWRSTASAATAASQLRDTSTTAPDAATCAASMRASFFVASEWRPSRRT